MIEPHPTTPPDLTSPTPLDTLQYGVRNVPIFTTVPHNDPWDHALSRYSASTRTQQNRRNLSLSVLVMHENEVHTKDEWSWNDSLWMARLQAIPGQTIQISCQVTNGSTYHRPTEIKTVYTDSSRLENYKAECYTITEPNSDCWYNLTFTKPIIVYCLWGYRGTELLFEFMIDTATSVLVAKDKEPLPPQMSENVSTRPPISLTPFTFNTGPYIIKNTGQQQVLFNLSYSLKWVELAMQTNISAIKPTCSPFLSTSYAGWSAWLHKRTLISPKRPNRDVTGVLGSGLRVLNSIDAEVLANKLATVTNDLSALKHPLQSSLSALGANQWLLSDMLPQWGKVNEKDQQLIVDALGVAQNNVSLALSCIQAQLWMQSIVAAIIREGEEGTRPTEIRKVIWDNATEFEKEFQSWWYPVNFTYDPTDSKATAFVLTICNASVCTIYPIIVLGLNHNGAILYPLEHRVWAQQNGNLWQTIDVSACVVWEQQGFICESNTLKAQDICLDTEQNVCHFEVQPDEAPETVLVYIGKGCVCMRTFCDFVFVDNATVDIGNHSNICVCNFTKIMGCDFNYSAPVTTQQLLQADYTLHQDLLPAPIGMNLALVRKLLQHDDLNQLLERIWNNGHKTLVTVHHHEEEIHHILEQVKQDEGHHWWDTLLGWSPTATGILNKILHPVVVLLMLTVLCFILTIVLYVRLWTMVKHLSHRISLQDVYVLDNAHPENVCDTPKAF
ncbi:uncharacterized protein [Ciconia boyciana]|uniref:uncharacterized protein n=1 Tax=Ciconia boyciana TaxID=52775 RepID=UPI003BA2E23D